MERQESSVPTRQDSNDQEIYEENEMYETTGNEEKQMMSLPNERRNLCVIHSQTPPCYKYTTGWNFDPSFTTNNTSTLIKEQNVSFFVLNLIGGKVIVDIILTWNLLGHS